MLNREKAPSPYFRAGEEILQTGIYRIFHIDHRVSHEAVLCSGQQFPRCNHCGDDVHFELLRAAPQFDEDENFRTLRLYEIPHPSDEDEQESPLEQAG